MRKRLTLHQVLRRVFKPSQKSLLHIEENFFREVQNWKNFLKMGIMKRLSTMQKHSSKTQILQKQTVSLKSDKTWLDHGEIFNFICNGKCFRTFKKTERSVVETCDSIAEIISEGDVEFDLAGKKIVFCQRTPDFKENLVFISKLLPEFNLSLEDSQNFKGRYVKCRKTEIYYTSCLENGSYPFPSPIL